MVYSIIYTREKGDPYIIYTVDWKWDVQNNNAPEIWARSEKEGARWYTISGLDDDAYNALLKHFGLEDCKDELPIERIIEMSWQDLGKMRRKLEKERQLPRKEIKSQAMGNEEYVP